MARLKVHNLAIGSSEDGALVAIDTGTRQYAWPTEVIPAIVEDLRALADFKDTIGPLGKSGYVMKSGSLILLTDQRGDLQAIADDGAVLMHFKNGGYTFKPKYARQLANNLLTTHAVAMQAAGKA